MVQAERARERELDEEIEGHLQMAARDRVDRGEGAHNAISSARRELGNLGLIKEAPREAWGGTWFDSATRDLTCGLRMLWRAPAFTAIAVITLALGIGPTTAIFSVVHAVLLKSLPYPEPERLVLIRESLPKAPYTNVAWPDYVDWKSQNRVFEQIAAFRPDNLNMIGESGSPETVQVMWVSAWVFSTLGTRPLLGRTLSDLEDRPGAETAVVVSYRFWQGELHGDAGVVGRTLAIEGDAIPIAGVLAPESKDMPWHADIYAPIGLLSVQANFTDRGNHPGIQVLARLRQGVSISEARSEMDGIMTRLGDLYPASNRGETAVLTHLNEWMVGGFRSELLLLGVAVTLVLLLACANVAHLLLARAACREREFGIRRALGAGLGRLSRQLIIESLVFSLLGAGAGVLLAWLGIPALVRLSPYSIPRLDEAGLDLAVLVFALGASLVTGLFFGLAPALQAMKVDVVNSIKGMGPGANSIRPRARLSSVLATAQVAIAFLVVTGSGLLIRSIIRVLDVDPGFRMDHLLTVELVRRGGADKTAQIFFAEAVNRVQNLPGVESASAVMCAPLTGTRWTSPYQVEGQPAASPSELPQTVLNMASPDYFQTIQASAD